MRNLAHVEESQMAKWFTLNQMQRIVIWTLILKEIQARVVVIFRLLPPNVSNEQNLSVFI